MNKTNLLVQGEEHHCYQTYNGHITSFRSQSVQTTIAQHDITENQVALQHFRWLVCGAQSRHRHKDKYTDEIEQSSLKIYTKHKYKICCRRMFFRIPGRCASGDRHRIETRLLIICFFKFGTPHQTNKTKNQKMFPAIYINIYPIQQHRIATTDVNYFNLSICLDDASLSLFPPSHSRMCCIIFLKET